MNGFRQLQERLREQGWFVEWNMPCCQSCAWAEIPSKHEVGPFKGQEIDLSKVLFNHTQDCTNYDDVEECPSCHGLGYHEEETEDGYSDEEDCEDCDGSGYSGEENTLMPEEQDYSLFCFDGGDEGVENLKEILPVIEDCCCEITWEGTGAKRPEITWSLT